MQSIAFYIGRLLLGGYFIMGGFNHFKMLDMMSGYAQSKGVPSPKAAVAFSGMLLWIGGLSILLGIFPTVGALALVLFLVPVTLMMHAFWKVQDAQMKMGETVNFMKNVALLGAALLLLSIPQPWSTSLF
ncbi:MAG TPA: DoxX family protein [Bacteroidota bacterium]|nr:DoxX family protein [Bacteroidota bacterium]